MGYEELLDTLIADGHKRVWVYWGKVETDEEDCPLSENLILTEQGDVVAQKINSPGSSGWAMKYWSLRKPLLPIPDSAIPVQLSETTALDSLCFFGSL
ncbi:MULTISPECIES: hypothetical protein [Enterobacter cloacae complex]|uniref:hypothetical protein n=1 Tax=Enterobacter cloacae complex TaxID=354276 RepID=UPI0007A762BE|nr:MULTISPECIES: hypothetical protein [Enterobacter cloacae complex]AVJ83624.1 hypothetical protein CSC02_5228 [Enterobacter hormaechei subsp. hoffmannii]HDX4395640.1 hypothetical protein [Enterobacter bugandensis]